MPHFPGLYILRLSKRLLGPGHVVGCALNPPHTHTRAGRRSAGARGEHQASRQTMAEDPRDDPQTRAQRFGTRFPLFAVTGASYPGGGQSGFGGTALSFLSASGAAQFLAHSPACQFERPASASRAKWKSSRFSCFARRWRSASSMSAGFGTSTRAGGQHDRRRPQNYRIHPMHHLQTA